jgi:outer membrane protein
LACATAPIEAENIDRAQTEHWASLAIVSQSRRRSDGRLNQPISSKGYAPMTNPLRLIAAFCVIFLIRPTAGFADDAGEWFVRVGVLEAIYNSSARIATSTGVFPGASASVTNNTTVLFDIGYDPSPNTFIMLMAGIPPKPDLNGTGTVNQLGKLGAVRYGPAILTAGYRIPIPGKLQPYVGAGVAHAIILHNYDAAVSGLSVHNNFGYALQTGVEYAITQRWQAFVDLKQLWLSVNADGLLGGVIPISAKVKLDPTIISAGIKFGFD